MIESIKLFRGSTYVEINSPLTFLQITTQSNSLISALNTNAQATMIVTSNSNDTYLIFVQPTVYLESDWHIDDLVQDTYSCNLFDSITPSGFYSELNSFNSFSYYWPGNIFRDVLNASAMINGFNSGCTPLDGFIIKYSRLFIQCPMSSIIQRFLSKSK